MGYISKSYFMQPLFTLPRVGYDMETKMGHRNSRSRVAQTRTLTKKRHRQTAFGPHEKKNWARAGETNAQGKKSDFLLTFVPEEKSPGLETVEVSADKETRPVKHVLLECRLYNRMRRGLRTEESNKAQKEGWRYLDLERRMGQAQRKQRFSWRRRGWLSWSH